MTTAAENKPGELSDTAWFPHDIDSANDPKSAALLDDFHAAGYGIFWHVVELLHNEPDGYLPLKPYIFKAIAKNMKASADLVERVIRACISEYELFSELEGKFTSDRVQSNKNRKNYIKLKRKEAGELGGKAKASKGSNGLANAKQMPGKSLANGKQNLAEEIRGEEILLNISSTILSLTGILKGTPDSESLCEAFLSAYPFAVIGSSRDFVKNFFRDRSQDENRSTVASFIVDLETSGPKASFFQDVRKYLEA